MSVDALTGSKNDSDIAAAALRFRSAQEEDLDGQQGEPKVTNNAMIQPRDDET